MTPLLLIIIVLALLFNYINGFHDAPFTIATTVSTKVLTPFQAVLLGIPVSTTHTITGAIIGVGATKRMAAVRWGVTINLVWAWIVTIPVSAVLAAIIYAIVSHLSIL